MRFLFVLIFISGLAFSQDVSRPYIDSILAIEEDKTLSSFKVLLAKVNQLPSEKAISKFKYIDYVIKDNEQLRLQTYLYYTSTLLRYGKNDEALNINTIGLQLAQKDKSPAMLFEYYQMRANIFDDRAIMDSTIFYINKAETVINENQETLGHKMTRIYQQRAILEQKLGNPEKEDTYIENIAKVVDAYPEKNMIFDLAMVVYHFKTKKNYAKHAYYAQKLRALYLKRDGFNAPKAHESLSSMLEMDNTEDQILELKHSLNSNDSLAYSFLLPQIANNLGNLLLETEKYEEAIYYFNKSLSYNDENVSPYSRVLSYQNLYIAYYGKRAYKEAIDALNSRNELMSTIRQNETLEKVAELNVKYETEKKTAEVQLLKAENRNKEQQKQVYLILALSGLVVASLFAFFAYKNSKQKSVLAKQKAELEKTVEQKNVLFKEIHHRVKNSLQMVSSLLFLQAQNIEDKEAKSAIQDAQNRVRSLGLIHQKLYGKKHLVGVETKAYIMELTQDIFSSHQLEAQHINYQLDLENMILNVDTLTPIGLILNELIVNVLKHAFKKEQKNKELHIKFYEEGNCLVLEVTDNGIGYNKNTIRKNSFGLKLIDSLSKRLEAHFSIESAQPRGTTAILIINDFKIIDTKRTTL